MRNEHGRIDLPIVLVGHMGAGKSSVGRVLAERLALPFFDNDEELERETGRTIDDLFHEKGEPSFRELERIAMERLVRRGTAVIATGAGAFTDPSTRSLVLSRCLAIWLKVLPGTLAERIPDAGGRPLLAGREPLEVLRELAQQRDPLYGEAQLHVDADAPVAEVVDRLLSAVGELERRI